MVKILDSRKPGPLHLKLEASTDLPLVHPAFVVKNWPTDATARVEVVGREPKAEDIRLGLEQELEGNNLVVWLGLETTEPIELRIAPVIGRHRGLFSGE